MKQCIVENCDGKYKAKGYCSKHYQRFKKHGDPNYMFYNERGKYKTCSIEGCNKPYDSKGLCGKHYNLTPISKSRTKSIRLEKKIACFNHYSGGTMSCICCGETEMIFLNLGHINNDGAQHRRTLKTGGGIQFYRWLVNNNFPNNPPLVVVCFNCNCGANVNGGICPHKTQTIK